MNKNLKLIAGVSVAAILLTACGAPSSSSSAAMSKADSTVSSTPPSSVSQPASVPSSAAPIVVETKTKQVEGFANNDFDSGKLYVNGVILKFGCTISQLDAQLEKTDKMRLYSDKTKEKFKAELQELKGGGAFGDKMLCFDNTEQTNADVGLTYLWKSGDEQWKFADTVFFGVEAVYIREANGKVPADVVLPNGWYLGGTISKEDLLSLTSEAPKVDEYDEFIWYSYPIKDEGIRVKLKMDKQTYVLCEIQMKHTKIKV